MGTNSSGDEDWREKALNVAVTLWRVKRQPMLVDGSVHVEVESASSSCGSRTLLVPWDHPDAEKFFSLGTHERLELTIIGEREEPLTKRRCIEGFLRFQEVRH